MATYPAASSRSYQHHDGGSGARLKVLALFLGIAVGVLVIVAAVLIRIADDKALVRRRVRNART